MLNNKNHTITDNRSTFSYQNNAESAVQVALFYGDEIVNEYDYHKKVPYYTSILKSGAQYDLPINKKREVYLYTFDKHGKRIDKQIITPVKKYKETR